MQHAYLTHMSMGFQPDIKSGKKDSSPDKKSSPDTKKHLKMFERTKIARQH